jgi:hypothetical protein
MGVLRAGLALEVARGAGEEGDVVDRAGHVEAVGESDRLAGLAALRGGQLTGHGVEFGGELVHCRRPLRRRRTGPAGEGGLRGGDCLVDVVDRRQRAGRDDVTVGRIGDRHGVQRAALAAPSVDELLARVVDRRGHGCSF